MRYRVVGSNPPAWWSKLKSGFTSDAGNVESALTLIPLMVLFLTVVQVGLSIHSRSVNDQITQGAVAYAAMGAATDSSLGAATGSGVGASDKNGNRITWSSPLIALPLPGGGSVLVGERQSRIPGVTPLLPGGESFSSTGIAVQE